MQPAVELQLVCQAAGPVGQRSIRLWIIFFFQAEDGIRDVAVTGVQTCALPIYLRGLDEVANASTGPSTATSSRPRRLTGERPTRRRMDHDASTSPDKAPSADSTDRKSVV